MREGESNPAFRHGHACKGKATPEYRAWQNMIERCCRETNIGFKNYGGRGIKVCAEWLYSFENFLADMGLKPSADLTLDRIDTNGNYCPENCRWADRATQRRSRRDSKLHELNGEKKPLAEWCNLHGIHYDAVWDRINVLGWTLQNALQTPLRIGRYRR